jgi:hypothetical protein
VENKRKFERRHLIYYLRVLDDKTGQPVGHLVDITKEGMMLTSEQPLENKKYYNFRLLLPTKILNKDEMTFFAKVIWCKKDVNPDYYATGFSTIPTPDEDEVIVDHLIHEYAVKN